MQVVQDSAQNKAALSIGIDEPNPALSSPYADYKVILSEMIDLKKEQVLRDPGDRVSDRRRVVLGLTR